MNVELAVVVEDGEEGRRKDGSEGGCDEDGRWGGGKERIGGLRIDGETKRKSS